MNGALHWIAGSRVGPASSTVRGGGVTYGAVGLPLAFVALPLYVVLPNHYASTLGVPLGALGLVLLGARLLDAAADPLIGRWADRLFARSTRAAWLGTVGAAVVVAIGFRALFFPPVEGSAALLAWCAGVLALTYLGYSGVSVVHQAWGARLGGDAHHRARVVAWREGFALAGVLVASVLPALAGLGATTIAFVLLLALGVAMLGSAPHPHRTVDSGAQPLAVRPFASGAFRRLLAVYLVNGIAAAIPATLVLFFIRDRLQAQALEPMFLASYFVAGAVSMPLWLRAVARFGLALSWLGGMALAVVTFIGAAFLGAGDVLAYTAVCLASGIALGADLALPPALLAGVVQRAGHAGQGEGAYFGWWNFATKLNLALAAGAALPALQLFGYSPGSTDGDALQALTLAYCVLPCALKLFAMVLLYILWIRRGKEVA
jgi:GPH family glycoside/pentoside/hexuronide:cation symporter